MKIKLLGLLICLSYPIFTNAQVSVFNAPNVNISPAKIFASKETPGDFRIVYTAPNSFGVFTFQNGSILSNNTLHIGSTAQELPLGLLEVAPNDFLIHGTSWARTGNFTSSILRLRNERLQWAKGFSICEDFTNLGFFSGIAQQDSSIYAIGSSRNTACGSPDSDFSAVKLNFQGDIQSQVSFIPTNGVSSDGMFFLQAYNKIFYYGGFSTLVPCGGGNFQSPGLGTFDANLQNRRWWTYEGVGFDLNGIIYQAHPFPLNPNRLVCNVRFSPDACTDTPAGVGLFVVDSLGNPVSALRFRTNNVNDLLFCRYSQVVLNDGSVVLAGRFTPEIGSQREFLLRTTPMGNVLFCKIIEPSNPADRVTFEDLVVDGQKIILVGKLQTNGNENFIVLQTDLNGVFPSGSNCLVSKDLSLTTQNLSIRKTNQSLVESQNMNSYDIPYRFSKERVSDVSCAICQSGNFPISAKVEGICGNTCSGRIELQGRDSSAYTYLWSNGRSNASIGGLCAGNYSVTITANGGCVRDTSFTIASFTPPQLNLPTTFRGTLGDSLRILAIINSPNGPITTYRWQPKNPLNTSTCLSCSTLGILVQTPDSIFLQIEDVQGCTAEGFTLLEVFTPFRFNARADTTCFNTCQGEINLAGIIDTTGFSFNWSNGQRTSRLRGLCAGRYTVTASDANGITRDTSIVVGATTSIRLSPETVNTCINECKGILRMNPVGGEGRLNFLWNTGATTSSITALCAGNYVITITDAKGCLVEDTFPVGSSSLNFTLQLANINCAALPSASIQVDSLLGGQSPYTYALNGGSFCALGRFPNLMTGQRYTISVKDANQCQLSKEIAIPILTPIVLSLPSLAPLPFGDTVLVVPVITSGGSALTYEWRVRKVDNLLSCTDCPTTTLTGIVNDTLSLMLRDEQGCEASAFTLLQVFDNTKMYIPNVFSPNNDQKNDIFTVFGEPGTGGVLLMRIFGRWGELVYEGANFDLNDLAKGWDGTFRGKPANPGVYVYVIEIQYRSGARALFKGDLHLLR
ncbi:MAG TPA: gliding motility-associated C-terminal domain-containing protein [Haliscomenobacter sp.]|nr:gliding motility-associated C-terminal domain-containing protein [Haliscomenobacter sp.]